jgi:tyrosine-protein kinase Etk/Wzc
MPQHDQQHAAGNKSSGSETIDLLEYLEVLVKHRRIIIFAAVIACFFSAAITLLLPNRYSSTTRILPPQQNSGMMGLLMGQAGSGMASIAGDLLGKGTPADQYVGILTSEAISDAIIDRFNLIDVYKKKYRFDTYQALRRKVDISVGKKDGIVSITFEDKDPKRAAAVANAFVDELDKLSAKLNITDAGNDRLFLETRLVKAKADLIKAEENVAEFQTKNKAPDVVEQAKGTIKGLGDLEGQLAIEEVKLASLKRVFTDNSQDVKNQKAIVANVRGQITKFEGLHAGSTMVGSGALPALGQQYLRLMREFKMQETLVEFLTKQYEIAKLSQAKEMSGVQVIQKATVSDKKSNPKRLSIVLTCTLVAIILSVLYAFLIESGSRLSEEDRGRLKRIYGSLGRKRITG